MRYLGGMDTMFVRAETESVHLHVTGVLLMRPRRGGRHPADGIRDVLAARLPELPPLRWRLVEPPGGFGALRWIEDADFDLDHHLRRVALPAPGTQRQLEELVSTVASTPLDRSRPLWEMQVVDGLADGSVALVSRFHHAFMDGGAGLGAIGSIFDLDPDAPVVPVPDERRTEPVPGPLRLLWELPRDAAARLSRIPAAAVATVRGGAGVIGAMFPANAPAGAAAEGSAGRSTLPPRTPFNGALSADRTIALVDSSLADVRTVKRAFDVSVNDVVLAAVASALRHELGADAAEEAGPLTAAVPVSVRADGDLGYGNHTSAMMVPLPTDVDDPVLRLMMIHERAATSKDKHREMGPDLIERWAGLIPPWLISAGAAVVERFGVAGRMPPVFNVIVSNVPGPPMPIYLAGAEVTGIYPLGPLLGNGGLNITVISRCDRLHIGVTGDPNLVPNPDAIADGIRRGVDELLDRVPPTAGAARRDGSTGEVVAAAVQQVVAPARSRRAKVAS